MLPSIAAAGIAVFDCSFPNFSSIVVTVFDDGSPARIGREQGVGDKAFVHFDSNTWAYIFVEFFAGGLPFTLTTVLKDGTA
jgi:hypothetical protein